jgi:hypothetical protein
MSANTIPFKAVGTGGVFELLAERLSSLPPERAASPAGAPAPRRDTPVARLMAEADARDTVVIHRSMYTRYAPGLPGPEGRAIVRCGMWSRLGFVGASLVAAGIVLLGNGGVSALAALGLVVGGGAVAAFSWRQAWKVLDAIDSEAIAASASTAPERVRPTLQQC